MAMVALLCLSLSVMADEQGKEAKLTHGTYGMFLVSPDRRVRKEAYEAFYKAYRGMKNTLTATYATSVKADVFRARAHKFNSAVEAVLFGNGVPVPVYE